MFVVIVTSCNDCNLQSVGIFENKPSQADIDEVDKRNGGMRCNRS